MIKTKLPIQRKTLNADGKIELEKKDVLVEVDTSIFAEQRWEAHFPLNAERETLFAYVERIQEESKRGNINFLSILKAVYCFIECDEIQDFKSFCQLFDISDKNYFKRLTDKIEEIFNFVLTSSATSLKN